MRALTSTLLILSLLTPSLASINPQRPFDANTSPEPSSSLDDGSVDRYDDQQVWRIDWSGMNDVNKRDIIDAINLLDFDIWHTTRSTIDIRLNPSQLNVLHSFIPSSHFTPFISNLQGLVDLSSDSPYLDQEAEEEEEEDEVLNSKSNITEDLRKKKNKSRKGKKPKSPKEHIDQYNLTTIETPFHDNFHPLKEMYKFGDVLISTFNGTNGIEVEEIDIGTTFEGKSIKGWTVKSHDHNNTKAISKAHNQPESGREKVENRLDDVELEFVVQAGQHGREWVGPSSALYFLHHLILRATTEPTSDAAILLRSIRFTIVPQINPDGYAYSRDKSRMWRKNRQEVGGKGKCLGIDLNSNWGYKWRSSKSTACSEGYAGKEAFEAYETKAMSEYLSGAGERSNRVRAFVDIHSYGQLFMFPFAHSCDDFPPDAEMLMEAGLGVAKAMRTKQGEGYEAGQACDLTYRAPGDAIDYTYGITDVRWSYSAELRDTGTYGFMLPPKLIRPTADELTAGLMYLAKFIYALEVNPP
ncbi:uncharacterized protein IL334_006620 [Kwoniella shivajii]|uniref:Inactive metallocarboxypeptidase ECM14 n=1 Tax=Kwoniella shivajii TaxID=564305 RepID=A0ABZ1D731_9TREE|nr:hypothetical protein IL334_006620 [Kwoniella shivajii]